jgi:hypothetical protein
MPERHRPFANHPCATQHPRLIEDAQLFLSLAIGSATRQSYTSGINSYITFSDSHGIHPAFPASIETLCLWISSLAAPPRRLRLTTCKVYLAGVISRHTEMGFNNPLDGAPPLLDRIFAGIKRWESVTTPLSKPKLPITTAMLHAMRPHLNLSNRSDSLLWAMMWTATAGLLRISEFTLANSRETDRSLQLRQLTLYDDRGSAIDTLSVTAATRIKHITLHLEASKTDPFRAGVDIIIASPTAIHALTRYIDHIKRECPLPASPLFMFPSLIGVKRSWLMKNVSRLLNLTGYQPQHYSSHSFRKGGAVSLQQHGVEDSIVRRIGRWKSDAFHLYVRDAAIDTIIDASARL